MPSNTKGLAGVVMTTTPSFVSLTAGKHGSDDERSKEALGEILRRFRRTGFSRSSLPQAKARGFCAVYKSRPF